MDDFLIFNTRLLIEVRDWWKMYDPGRDGRGAHYRWQGIADYRDFLFAKREGGVGFFAKEWMSSRTYTFHGLFTTPEMLKFATEGGYTQRRGQHYPVPVAQKKGEKGKPRSGDGLKAKTKRVVESLIAASDSHTDDELKDGRALVPSFCQQLL